MWDLGTNLLGVRYAHHENLSGFRAFSPHLRVKKQELSFVSDRITFKELQIDDRSLGISELLASKLSSLFILLCIHG